ncbi:MAG: Ig-like domain-containing protein [Lachnospiraceae bacterium]|nr:Ig-like domain-containing protein [Lachnospiraceae bacterium]
MKTKKKLLAGLLTLVMVLSSMYLPGGMVAEAASDSEQVDYCIYFDAANGKLYKEAGFNPSNSNNPEESWVPKLEAEYTGDGSITCNGNELTLNNFYLFPKNIAIIIKGDAVIKLSGENTIDSGNFFVPRCGIYAYDNLSIAGTGSLKINGFNFGVYASKNLNIKDVAIDAQSSSYAFHVKGNFVMESGSVTGGITSFYGDDNGGHHAHATYGICVDGNLVVNGGVLTGRAHGSPAYGVKVGGDVTVNGGTLSGHASLVVAANPGTGYGVFAGGKIIANGGTMEGASPNREEDQYHSYGAYAEQSFVTGSNIEIVGGYKEYLHSNIQLAADNKYFKDIIMDKECRYIKFTTPVSGIGGTSPSNPNVVIGESTDLDVTVIPENASNQNIKWESSDDTIASVDENGKVTAHKEGTVTITATTEDGGYKKEITITVSKKDGAPAPTGITTVAPTTEGGSDGKIIGVDSTMEYSTNADFTDAKPCTDGEVTGLPAGTYYVRVKETDSTKAGEVVVVVVPAATVSAETQKSIMDGLGVSEEIANQILKEAEKLGVSTDTLLITDESIKKQKSDADIKGSTFGLLKARTTNLKKNSVTIKWDKVKDADGYILYGNKCGKNNSYKRIKTFTKNSTVKYTQKKLKKGTYYKYLVVAYKKINGVKVTIAAAKTVHATTKGGKYGVAKSVKVNKTSKTLAVSKTFKIKASEVKLDKKISQHRKIKYESDNKKIATVSSKGVVKAKKKGTCYIYVYAQNGVYKKIKITVK